MIKKVKKIPKYNSGIVAAGNIKNPYLDKINTRIGVAPPAGLRKDNSVASGGSGFDGWGGTIGAAATAGGRMLMDAFGVEDNSQLGVTLNTSMQGAEIGGSIVPGWGHLIGGVAGGLIGATKSGSVDENTGEILYGGIFGHSKEYLRRKSNMIKNSIQAQQLTQNLQAQYVMNPNNPTSVNVLAAEGGIMRQPVDALVSKGELIYNPMTKKLSKVPGSKGKPNKADDVYARLSEGDVVISNSPTMLMANGKTPAQNLEGLVDSDKNVKAKEAIIKKVVNWQEANKTKPQEYTKYDVGGTVVKIGKDPIAKLEEELFKQQTTTITGNDPLKNLTKEQRGILREAIKIQNGKSKTNWLNRLSDYAPLASALLGNYDYHREEAMISPAKYIPTGVSIDPIRRAADESYAIARYNQANISPNTGAGMAYGLQAATNRTKALADAYQWQQEQQNKLIAQNAGIYNDWSKRYDAARYKAIENTMANEAAARQMRDQAIKDAYEFQTGRRNDRWKLSMIEPLMKYAVDENIYKQFRV